MAEQDLSCSICCELFKEPVFLSCSHSFCQVCLERRWKDTLTKNCPVCNRKYLKKKPPLNRALKSLVSEDRAPEQTSPRPPPPQCSLHSEELCLFCEEHQELLCLLCKDSTTHKEHSFRTIREAAFDLREELRSSMRPVLDHLKLLDQSRAHFDSAVGHVSAQARLAQTQIRAQFDKLHQFLREEEESRMKALREEEEQKIQRMKEQMAALSRDMEEVSQTISETEEQLRAADVSFLLQYKAAVQKVQRCPLVEEPQMERDALIDRAKHLGNLGFNIWRNMKSLVTFYPVVLDPNTADRHLVLSEDLSSARRDEDQDVPQNPERSRRFYVHGSEELLSGTHSWDVEVGGSTYWAVGVSGRSQSWRVTFEYDEYTVLADTVERLSVKNLQRVRVTLDFDTRTLTFSDPDTNTDLHTDGFSDGMTPFLQTDDGVPLKILPKNISVTV